MAARRGFTRMNHREHPYLWPIPCGTWFATRVSISAWLPLLLVVICWRLESLQLGLVFGAIFLISILVHEFAHVVAARMTGGAADEILLWPFGGLAFTQPGDTLQSRLLTPAAGPLSNLVLCGLTLKAVLDSPYTSSAFHPLEVPPVNLEADPLASLLVLTFVANWVLLLVNLLPVYPLDGGQILQTALTARWGNQTGIVAYIRIGFAVGLIAMFVGLLIERGGSAVVFLGAIILLLNMQEMYQLRSGESYDESFMGYDFSQGYTSLERSAGTPVERRPGFLERWKERRRLEKLQRKQEQAAQVELELDHILDKVHQHGIESLTVAERRLLDRASNQFRERQKEGE
jgi:stage IV sporulation protein FB